MDAIAVSFFFFQVLYLVKYLKEFLWFVECHLIKLLRFPCDTEWDDLNNEWFCSLVWIF